MAGKEGSGLAIHGLAIIGERINPGFRSTRALFETGDIAGIQALARRQADAGAAYLNINAGPQVATAPEFLVTLIRAVQAVVDLPLCFDSPDVRVQQVCLEAYDADQARGRRPIINSITEARWHLPVRAGGCPARVIVMASERMENGEARQNRTAEEIHATARRCLARLTRESGLVPDDVIVDVSIGALAADTEGATRAALDAVERIGCDPDLAGVHLCGGLSNIAQQLPAATRGGLALREGLENAFLTLAVARGLDMIIGTPWRDYHLLPADDPVYAAFSEIVVLDGRDALRRLLQLQRS